MIESDTAAAETDTIATFLSQIHVELQTEAVDLLNTGQRLKLAGPNERYMALRSKDKNLACLDIWRNLFEFRWESKKLL